MPEKEVLGTLTGTYYAVDSKKELKGKKYVICMFTEKLMKDMLKEFKKENARQIGVACVKRR